MCATEYRGMKRNIPDAARTRINNEITDIMGWAQRQLIAEGMVPGPYREDFHLDEVLRHIAGKVSTNFRANAIYSAALAVSRTWSSREGVREQTIETLEDLREAICKGVARLRDPQTMGYAQSADVLGQQCIGLNEEPPVRTSGLQADLRSIDVDELEAQTANIDRVLAKLIERRPATLAAGLMGTRTIGPKSCFCYELYKFEEDGVHTMSLDDIATIIGEINADMNDEQRELARDRVRQRINAVKDKIER